MKDDFAYYERGYIFADGYLGSFASVAKVIFEEVPDLQHLACIEVDFAVMEVRTPMFSMPREAVEAVDYRGRTIAIKVLYSSEMYPPNIVAAIAKKD